MLKHNSKIKVSSVSGKMISDANYHHGDASASDTISKMAANYTGSNNISPFIGKGAFGSKFVKEASAPRYIFVKPNKKFFDLYNDFEICESDDDPENPEPKFYLPIIPTILLNGIEGIAVGFACKIQPYNIKEIIYNIKRCFNNQSQKLMTPFYSGYTGKIYWVEDKAVMFGRCEIINTTKIHISEVPVSYDREKYNKFLVGLENKKLIHSFEDNSKNNWDITIKLPRSSKVFQNPMKYLGLTHNLNENITLIDEDGKLIVLDNVNEIIEKFVKYRITRYQKRIAYKLYIIREETLLTKTKMEFIIEMGKFDFRKTTKVQLNKHFKKLKFRDDHLEKCFQMSVTRLNRENLLKLKERLNELKEEYFYYKNTTPKKLYSIDLKGLK